ncbi:replication initiation protein [Aureivirga sp. CE67]|uniref:replication initiation protein n=1 Tax=Aureivirga sp. CE67 TaxID=1788983 RepID=UPI0018CB55AD|nr:replication initiation protein [Aureivirga sp. CE67]
MLEDKPNIVRKGNLLISSKLNLTRNESRILELVFSQINPFEDVAFKKEYRVDVYDVVKIKNNHRVYTELETIASSLTSKNIHLKQGDGSFEFLTITNRVRYDVEESAFFVELNDNLLSYLLKSPAQIAEEKRREKEQLRQERINALIDEREKWAYTSYQLKYHLIIQSNHALRIYELLKQYEKIGSRTLTVEEIKIVLEIEDKYKAYADFKRNVILISQKELANKTDIKFEFTEIKKRRRVHAIQFNIYKNENISEQELKKKIDKTINQIEVKAVEIPKKEIVKAKPKQRLTKEESRNQIISLLQNLKKPDEAPITRKKAEELIEKYGITYLRKCIHILQKEDPTSKNNFVGYVIKSIENGWMFDKKVSKSNKKEQNLKEIKKRKDEALQKENEVRNQYAIYWKNQRNSLMNAIKLSEEKESYLNHKISIGSTNIDKIKDCLEKENEKSADWAFFMKWLEEKFPKYRIKSFEEFSRDQI